MTVHTNAKSRLFIGAANNTISELSEFEAESWLEIKEVEDIGGWAALPAAGESGDPHD